MKKNNIEKKIKKCLKKKGKFKQITNDLLVDRIVSVCPFSFVPEPEGPERFDGFYRGKIAYEGRNKVLSYCKNLSEVDIYKVKVDGVDGMAWGCKYKNDT